MTERIDVSTPAPHSRVVDASSGELRRPGVFPRQAPHRLGHPPRWVVLLGLVAFCIAAWAAAFWIVFRLI